jgi:hypothetical protein
MEARAALHHRRGTLGERGEAVARHVVRDAERLARGVLVERALQRLARRKRDGMHQPVEAVPALAELGEQRVDLGVVRHVAGIDHVGAEFLRQVEHAFTHALALVGEGELRALAMAGLGNPVRDRPVGKHAGHENPPVLQEAHLAVPSP